MTPLHRPLLLLFGAALASASDFERDLNAGAARLQAAKRGAVAEVRAARFVVCGPADVPAVALTFDDGPGKDTPAILDVLARHGAKATFFMVGVEVMRFREIARRVTREGHEVGNHTLTHPNLCSRRLQPGEGQNPGGRMGFFEDEVLESAEAIAEATGVEPSLLRLPYACRAAWAEEAGCRLGMTVVRWSVDGRDWKKWGPEAMARYYLRRAKPGAILLLHDGGGDRRQTVEALKLILVGLRRRGLKAVTVGELIAPSVPAAPASSR